MFDISPSIRYNSFCQCFNHICASGSVVEYRLAKARVAGSNPVSRSQMNKSRISVKDILLLFSSPILDSKFECLHSVSVRAGPRSTGPRAPSRAFCPILDSKFECLHSVSVRAGPRSTGPCAPSRAFCPILDSKFECLHSVSVRAGPRSTGPCAVYTPFRSAQDQGPLDLVRRLALGCSLL